MRYDIRGTVMQTVEIDLAPGETVYSQTSCMCWMDGTIAMNTDTGGVLAGLKRSVAGGSLFLTRFTAKAAGQVAFAPRFPGTIMTYDLRPDEALVCRKESFLCAEASVTLSVAWQKRLGAGVFGGEGFVLQRVTGPGRVWLDLSGEVVERDLAAGQRLLVHAGHVGIMEPSVTFDIQRVPGIRNVLFGGEGLFLATLTGPGHVVLQSMPVLNLAEAIGRYLPVSGGQTRSGGSMGGRIVAGMAGAVLGGLFRGSRGSRGA